MFKLNFLLLIEKKKYSYAYDDLVDKMVCNFFNYSKVSFILIFFDFLNSPCSIFTNFC